MPIRGRIKSAAEKTIFRKDGRYFQRKAAIEASKKNSLKHQRALKASEKIYAAGMAKAAKLRGDEKIKFLENLENLIYQKGVMPTYNAEKSKKHLEQSPAHNKISSMMADIRFKVWEIQDKAKKKR